MIAQIQSLQRGSRTLKNGNNQTGLNVTFFNAKNGNTKKEFLSDYHNSEIIAILEQVGVNNFVDVQYTKKSWNGKDYWNVTGVTPAAQPDTMAVPSRNQGQAASGSGQGGGKPTARTADNLIRQDAVMQAINVVNAHVDRMSDAAKKKLTMEIILGHVLDTAEALVKFVKSEAKPETKPATPPAASQPPVYADDPGPDDEPEMGTGATLSPESDDDIPF